MTVGLTTSAMTMTASGRTQLPPAVVGVMMIITRPARHRQGAIAIIIHPTRGAHHPGTTAITRSRTAHLGGVTTQEQGTPIDMVIAMPGTMMLGMVRMRPGKHLAQTGAMLLLPQQPLVKVKVSRQRLIQAIIRNRL